MKEKILSILIIKPSSLGDIVHALPVSPELRKLYPESKICWLVFDHFSEILSGNKYINEIIIWKRHGDFSYNIALIKEIRNHRFDLVIDLQGLLRTALISLLSGARKRIGVPGLREFSYLFEKEVATFKPTQHAVERNLEVIKYLGEPPGMPEFYINISDEEKKFADNLL
ncbi:MAG: glycosyltransferase family 9 protein, partial [Elusimicrobiota bacterium]